MLIRSLHHSIVLVFQNSSNIFYMNTDQYSFNDARYGTHALIAEEIGSGFSVLDVGCNKGYLKLLSKGNDFYGIDYDENDLKQALSQGYKEVYRVDLNAYREFSCAHQFDVIVFGDVLEHLLFPQEVLSFFLDRFLKDGGKVIISLPNVANIVVRMRLLFGQFDYTESGILDRTHLHLYTKKTAREFIEHSGLVVTKEKYSSNRFGGLIDSFPVLGGLLGFNLIFVCRKKY